MATCDQITRPNTFAVRKGGCHHDHRSLVMVVMRIAAAYANSALGGINLRMIAYVIQRQDCQQFSEQADVVDGRGGTQQPRGAARPQAPLG
jgi:hypothetical protein